MGKKHVIETNQEELIKEQEKIDKKVGKDASPKPAAGAAPVVRPAGVQGGKVYIFSSYNNT